MGRSAYCACGDRAYRFIGMRSAATRVVILVFVLAPASAAAAGDADVAALQVALRDRGLYAGPVDGLNGPQTMRGVRELAGAPLASVDAARAAAGRYGRHRLGERLLRVGLSGWDVASFQFLLAWRGFASGPIDGAYGERTASAVRRFQAFAGLAVDGVGGPRTIAAVRRRPALPPYRLLAPVRVVPSDFFGPRADRFHTGVDYAVPLGSPVRAAGAGRVSFAGWHAGGYGFLVVVAHGRGLRTLYAHLARLRVRVGQRVAARTAVGDAGATGHATGPHLHFELRFRGAAVDPLPALG